MKKKEAPKHYWNMRVLTKKFPNSDEREFFMSEVHYEDGIPTGYSYGVYNYGADDVKGLKWKLNRMKDPKKPMTSSLKLNDMLLSSKEIKIRNATQHI